MKLLSVIINYKTAEMTLRALDALLREMAGIPSAKIVVIDNDSQDGSFDKLSKAVEERKLAPRVEVWRSDYNGGFGYGNNYVIRQALAWEDKPEYVYLLNSDAFPEPRSIEILVEFMESHPDAGFAGSFLHGTDGIPHESAFRFPSVASELETTIAFRPVSRILKNRSVAIKPIPKEPARVDWLAGASMMIRSKMLEQVGLFDETFFLYFEETDLCRRAAQHGWSTWYVPESSVAHIGSVSTGMKNRKRRTPGYWFESREHYFLKNHGSRYLLAANLVWLFGFSLRRARVHLQGKEDVDAPKMLADFISHNFLRKSSK
jgi:N-acetylglucosaminyl-diphospho-decaprenol L-rhamnosyltransferase